jgi:hypothetical protein
MCGNFDMSSTFTAFAPHDKQRSEYQTLYRFNTERSRWQEYDSYLNGWVNTELGDRKAERDERMGRNILSDWDETFQDDSRIVKYDTTWADAEYITGAQIDARYRQISSDRDRFENDEYLGDFGDDPFEFDQF